MAFNKTSIIFVLFFLMTVILSTVEAKKKKEPTFVNDPILTSGTLFYIAISVSFALWCTGYGLDYVMDRHEKQANTRAFQKYNVQAY
ncbi:hypothetical protein BDC45DRAFT_503722 [Circinella umbellata]|nr:hypothetical protein BDC45DRAFT_503722 [Circinella umbellata]